MPARRLLAAAGLAVLLGACATTGEGGNAAPAAGAAERGGAIAARECSRCHAVGPVGDSPRAGAPPLRDVRIRYNALSFERRMAEIAEGGHFEMPPLRLDRAEVDAVAAYIESLEPH